MEFMMLTLKYMVIGIKVQTMPAYYIDIFKNSYLTLTDQSAIANMCTYGHIKSYEFF